MAKKHLIDRLHDVLFDADKLEEISASDREIALRYQDAFTQWLEKPYRSDSEIRDYLMDNYGLGRSQAYRDIGNIKLLLGNVRNAAKDWQLYKVNLILDKAIEVAEEGNYSLAKAYSNIAKEITRANRLNINEGEQIPWDEVIPQTFEPSSDPTTIGLKPIENLSEKIAALKKKYNDDIQEVDYTEIEN